MGPGQVSSPRSFLLTESWQPSPAEQKLGVNASPRSRFEVGLSAIRRMS